MTRWEPEIKYIASCIGYVNYKLQAFASSKKWEQISKIKSSWLFYKTQTKLASYTAWSVGFGNFSGPHCPVFGLSEYGKIQTIKTPNMDTFYAVTLSIKRPIKKKGVRKFKSVYYTPFYFTSVQHWQNSEISKLYSKISKFWLG